jgi:hypothetical protein
MKVKIIDPPSGWKYGFPKALPNPEPEDVRVWLVSEGYPQSEIDRHGYAFCCRFWEEEIDDQSMGSDSSN